MNLHTNLDLTTQLSHLTHLVGILANSHFQSGSKDPLTTHFSLT